MELPLNSSPYTSDRSHWRGDFLAKREHYKNITHGVKILMVCVVFGQSKQNLQSPRKRCPRM